MSSQKCPRCGRDVALDAPGGLCAACLLEAGAETFSSGSGSTDFMPTVSSAAAPATTRLAPRLREGERWGSYQIGRLLGRGGMGEVYEAEHLPSGRRVALKVLSSPLQSAEERARFLREGQLAASVSHPHTVYIFGSEEIDGTPVISMELLPGGTLKDRVVQQGPMRPAEAVAAIMELIGGLDAAAAAGILHRDIKPSNCFIDRDGVVKIGDFGLSISTLARDVHQLVTSGFEGTPQFAPPEQLRGEPLDVRADIYAVGATLYYLLTGRAPFDAPDLRELFAKVTHETPVPPHQLRRDIPSRVSAVVMRCLAKDPGSRPSSYPALADTLRPFVTRHDRPAPIATRLLAGLLDSGVIVGIPVSIVTTTLTNPLTASPERTAVIANLGWAATLAYYVALEGAFGASLGKKLFGLRIISEAGSSPSWPQAAVRALLFYAPNILVAALILGHSFPERLSTLPVSSGWYIDWKQSAPPLLLLLMFFSTARRSNGWTGLHDVLSRTRVIARPPAIERSARFDRQPAVAAVPSGSGRRYGPFVAMDAREPRSGTTVRAFDPVLRREVWIQIADAATPPISNARRDLSRVARLHWLAGRRSADENWDAYEAPGGAPWTTDAAPDAWRHVRLQLLDLASELAASAEDSTQPPLALDRIWLRENGRIVLLDFAPPDAARDQAAALTPEQLLQAAVARVPRHLSEPSALPLSARAFLERWSAGGHLPTIADARTVLLAMAAAPTDVHRWRRAIPGTLAASPVAVMLLAGFFTVPALRQFADSDGMAMLSLLGALEGATRTVDLTPGASVEFGPGRNPMREPEVRTAAEVAIAGRYAHLIRDEAFWNTGVVNALAPEYRPLAEEILARHPNVSPEQLADAEAVLKAARPHGSAGAPREANAIEAGGIVISTLTAAALAFVLLASVLSSLVVPGGLVSRQLGLTIVTRSGREITRARSMMRTLIAGLPALVWLIYLALSPKVQGFVPTPPDPVAATLVTVGILAVGLAWTVVGRTRGPHDLLAGTWVVPR